MLMERPCINPTTSICLNRIVDSFGLLMMKRENIWSLLFQLGQACMAAGKSVRAIQCFLQCLELDRTDHQNVRQHLVSAFLDEGRTGEARALMDKYNTESNTVFAFSRLMTEYVAWHVLQEPDASEVCCMQGFSNA